MQVTIEKKSGINCSLLIEVPAVEIDNMVSKKIIQTAKSIKLNGFRPGKVPISLVKKEYGEQLRFEVISEKIIPTKYAEAVQNEQLKVADVKIDLKENKEGQPLKFIANVELFPQFEVTGFEKLLIQKPIVKLGDEEVKQKIESLRKHETNYFAVDRATKKDDKVTIDFVGEKNGKDFEGGTANDVDIIIGSNQMVPGFEDGIVDMTKDQQKEITVTFPKEYQSKDLAGCQVLFYVTVKKIQQPKLPEINEEFIKKLGIKSDIEGFEGKVKENMERELKFVIQKNIKNQIFKGLREIIEFDIPQSLIKREVDAAKQNLLNSSGGGKSDFDISSLPDNLFEDNAKQNVKISLILDSIIESKNIQVEDKEIDCLLNGRIQVFEGSEKIKEQIKQNPKEVNKLKALIIENKLVDWILGQVKIIDKEKDYFEILKEDMQSQQAVF